MDISPEMLAIAKMLASFSELIYGEIEKARNYTSQYIYI